MSVPHEVLSHYRGVVNLSIRTLFDRAHEGRVRLHVSGHHPGGERLDQTDEWMASFVSPSGVSGWSLYTSVPTPISVQYNYVADPGQPGIYSLREYVRQGEHELSRETPYEGLNLGQAQELTQILEKYAKFRRLAT